MRYWIFGLLILVIGCATADAQQRGEWDDVGCAVSVSFGSVSVGDNRRYVSPAEAAQWCRAQRLGLPYTSIQGGQTNQTIIRTDDGATTLVCFDLGGGIIKCRER